MAGAEANVSARVSEVASRRGERLRYSSARASQPRGHFPFRRRGQVVRRQTANLLFVGSIPTGASVQVPVPASSPMLLTHASFPEPMIHYALLLQESEEHVTLGKMALEYVGPKLTRCGTRG